MKKAFLFLSFIMVSRLAKSQPVNDFAYPVYTGADLGLKYAKHISRFRIWSPTAMGAELLLFSEGLGGTATERVTMKKGEKGTWTATLTGDRKGKFYSFRVKIGTEWSMEVADPYVKLVGANGKRGMIGDLRETEPVGWKNDRSPKLKHATDAVIYELHIRDASIAANSGIREKGKYLGLAEKGTINTAGGATGLDHLKEMGVTHVHLLPFFDFLSVDETRLDRPQYNWGYEPVNYNAPEGSYSSNPADGLTRCRELKQMIAAFHKENIGIVMDVVYNHTMLTDASSFNQLVPGYYYRHRADGTFSNGTACGNETASERPMMRKFMIESLLYWVKEYHVDGFRFDLMGVHDIETMNEIARALRRVRPDILLYGEGWTAGDSPLPDDKRAIKKNVSRLEHIAVFSDDIRDGIKGSVFEMKDRGFASGKTGNEQSIRFGIVAACRHPQVDYSKVNYSKAPYASEPASTVTYAECHDNNVLWDKLAISAPDASEEERKEMQRLALSIVLTSQGIAFLHAGTEFLRTKKGNENSYNAGDSINAIDWDRKTQNVDVVEYISALIHMRRAHAAFRMNTAKDIAQRLKFIEGLPKGVIGYTINAAGLNDSWASVCVYFNGGSVSEDVQAPGAAWRVFVKDNRVSGGEMKSNMSLAAHSCTILYQ